MQTKKQSITEALVNIGSGMIIAFTVTQIYAHYHTGVTIPVSQNIILTILLTFVSVTRSYIWRRVFNKFTTCKKCGYRR